MAIQSAHYLRYLKLQTFMFFMAVVTSSETPVSHQEHELCLYHVYIMNNTMLKFWELVHSLQNIMSNEFSCSNENQ